MISELPPALETAPPPAPTSPVTQPPHAKSTAPRIGALWCLLIVVGCVTAAEVFLKMGAQTRGLATLTAPYTIIGIGFHIVGFTAWAYTLRSLPLSLAFNFVTLQQVMVPLGAWFFLHEQIIPLHWAGIGLVLTGVFLLVPSIVAVESKTEAHP